MDIPWDLIISYSVQVVGALALIIITFILARKIKSGIASLLTRTGKVEETLAGFISTAGYWAFLIMAMLSILSKFGVETTSFAAVIGGASLAIGLAFQGSLSNLAAGVMLLVFRPFKVGNFIRVAGETGTVTELGLFTTKLRTLDNRVIIIPNANVFGSTIENLTAEPLRRVDIDIDTSGAGSLQAIRDVLEAAAAKVEGALNDGQHANQVYMLGNTGGTVHWQVRVWCDTNNFWDVRQSVNTELRLALDSAGMVLTRPFEKGDLVKLGGEVGIVDEKSLFATRLKTLDNRVLTVPNGAIAGSIIENITGDPLRRVDVNVGTDYGADLREVRAVLEACAKDVPGVLNDGLHPNQIFLSDLGDSSINWQVRVWCSTAVYWDVWQATTLAIKESLDAANIGIPFPQMDIHHEPLS